jgi:hypothetical protein
VSLRFADGAQLPVLPGMPGWRMLSVMGPGDVLTVASGAGAAPAGHPAAVAPRSAPAGFARPRGPFSPVEGVPLPEEQLNHKRLHMLFLSEPAEIRKALQQVRLRPPSYELSFTLSLVAVLSLRMVRSWCAYHLAFFLFGRLTMAAAWIVRVSRRRRHMHVHRWLHTMCSPT